MKDNKKYGLQLFAAPDGMTGAAQIQIKAREIDFVTSFGENMQALLDVMGITRMIRKQNGSVLKTKKVSGALADGNVAEGDTIPLSQYAVEERVYDSIKIEKYRKGVSLEAISERGYDAAVEMTDAEFKSDLQNKVVDRFYAMLKKGSLVGHEATWQMAVAMSIGHVKDKFKKMKRSATGVAVWVNTLDVYKYVGAADITLQTAFGMEYVENFLGADLVFVSSEVPEGVVIATPLNNIVAYYVDPADSEFVRAGLSYTTDGATGFIGFHAEGNYDRAISDMFAIMGVRLFAEHLDAIAHITVGGSDSQTLGELTLTSVKGEEDGKTAIGVSEPLSAISNVYKYKTGVSATTVTYGMDVRPWKVWDGKSEITATAGDHVTVVEADANYKAIASGDVVADVKA